MKDHQLHGHIGVRTDGTKYSARDAGLASVIVDSPEYDFKLLTTNKGDIWHEEMAGQLMSRYLQ